MIKSIQDGLCSVSIRASLHKSLNKIKAKLCFFFHTIKLIHIPLLVIISSNSFNASY
jgi:hypothetical protein